MLTINIITCNNFVHQEYLREREVNWSWISSAYDKKKSKYTRNFQTDSNNQGVKKPFDGVNEAFSKSNS